MSADKGNLWKAMAMKVVKLGTLDGGSFAAEGGGEAILNMITTAFAQQMTYSRERHPTRT